MFCRRGSYIRFVNPTTIELRNPGWGATKVELVSEGVTVTETKKLYHHFMGLVLVTVVPIVSAKTGRFLNAQLIPGLVGGLGGSLTGPE